MQEIKTETSFRRNLWLKALQLVKLLPPLLDKALLRQLKLLRLQRQQLPQVRRAARQEALALSEMHLTL
jgi:hypothetical protein